MNEYEIREHLSDEDIERLENYRDFHLFFPESEESERKRAREVEVTIFRDGPGD